MIETEVKTRICKKCNLIKDLTTDFQLHSATGFYSRTCKSCTNEERRLKKIPTIGRREGSILIKQKVCTNCKILKDLNSYNFGKEAGRFSKICKVCREEYLENRKKLKRKGKLPDTETKICTWCEKEKFVTEFAYLKRGGYSSHCRKCLAERAQERRGKLPKTIKPEKSKEERFISSRATNIIKSYQHFDFSKGYQTILTREFVEQSLRDKCRYCGYSPSGLDRINNKLGHTEENCIPCCKECNVARNNNFTYQEMIDEIGPAIKRIKDKRINKEPNG